MTSKRIFFISLLALSMAMACAFYLYYEREPRVEPELVETEFGVPSAASVLIDKGALEKRTRADAVTAQRQTALSAADKINSELRIMDVDIGLLARNYQQLAREASNGSLDAANSLLRGTSVCRDTATTQAEFAAFLRLRADPRDARPGADDATKFLLERFNRCAPLSSKQRAEWRKWMGVAADLGSSKAQSAYIMNPPERSTEGYYLALEVYKEKSQKYLSDALASGDPVSLLVASSAYGLQNGINYDRVLQLAYSIAYSRAIGRSPDEDKSVLTLGARMTPSEMTQAEELAATIFSDWSKSK